MENNEFDKIGLYKHNAESYRKVREAFESGERIVAIVHATGTGKSYNALQLAYDNRDKRILYIVPGNSISEHIKEIISGNENIDLERDFPNLEFRTYQSFINSSREEIEELDVDLLILDEFHHLGAPVWGARVDDIVETHEEMKIFGMTAYTVRARGTSYERDMVNDEGGELFSGKVVSTYDLCDALIDGVLPKPIYRSAYIELQLMIQEIESQFENIRYISELDKEGYRKEIEDAKKRVHEALGTRELIKKYVKPGDKGIYFCPVSSEEGVNDIETIKKEVLEILKEYVPEEDIIFYETTSEDEVNGKKNRDAFYNDRTLDGEPADGKLRIMFAKNQYNEGVHAPGIDFEILGRATESDIVFFEQLGRALSVRGDTKQKIEEYEKLTREELIEKAKEKDIKLSGDCSKEEIIQKLIGPIIIDLAGNYYYMRELENNLKERIEQIKSSETGEKRDIKIGDVLFDIEVENQELYDMLFDLNERLSTLSWNTVYNLAKAYYEHHGNLRISMYFKTINGYDEILELDEASVNGIVNLGLWIKRQRDLPFKIAMLEQKDELTIREKRMLELLKERYVKLNLIGMVWERNQKKDNEEQWDYMYSLAEQYFVINGNLNIPDAYLTENNERLGNWVSSQLNIFAELEELESKRNLTVDQIKRLNVLNYRYEKLNNLGIEWGNRRDNLWNKKYELAKIYFSHHGNLDVPKTFYTLDGYTQISSSEYDKMNSQDQQMVVNLGMWIVTQKKMYVTMQQLKSKSDLSTKQKLLLQSYIERVSKLDELGMNCDVLSKEDEWERKYNCAFNFFQKNGHLKLKTKFMTLNGYEEVTDEQLAIMSQNERNLIFDLYAWLGRQKKIIQSELERMSESQAELSEEGQKYYEIYRIRYDKLNKIGMIWKSDTPEDIWDKNYSLAEAYYIHYGNLDISGSSFRTDDGITTSKTGMDLKNWLSRQREMYEESCKLELNEQRTMEESEKLEMYKYRIDKLSKIGMIWQLETPENVWDKNYSLAQKYYEHYGNLIVPSTFYTKDGYTQILEEEYINMSQEEQVSVINLGSWLSDQRKKIDENHRKNFRNDQRQRLDSIGMVWNIIEYQWNEQYKLAKIYYERYGTLETMGKGFRTLNGIDFDEKGKDLYDWVVQQRGKINKKMEQLQQFDSLSVEEQSKLKDLLKHYHLLNEIGMIWDKKPNKQQNIELLEMYGINPSKNKFLSQHITHQELSAKIQYLLANNIPVVVDGEPNELLFMSDINMQVKYNISRKELIDTYYVESDKKKGV